MRQRGENSSFLAKHSVSTNIDSFKKSVSQASELIIFLLKSLFSSYDVRGDGVEIGRHWNDGVNLGARARYVRAGGGRFRD